MSKQYITELVEMELLARENPNPNDRNQKYITTEAGKLYVEENDNRRKTKIKYLPGISFERWGKLYMIII